MGIFMRTKNGAIVGQQIERARRVLGIGQEELGELLAAAEGREKPYSVQMISKWETGGRKHFPREAIEIIAQVMKQPCDYFTTDSDPIFPNSEQNSIRRIDERPSMRLIRPLPIVPFERLRWGVMDQAIQEHNGETYTPKFERPGDERNYSFRMIDDSMEPLIIRDASIVSCSMDIEPQPGNIVHADLGKTGVVRVFTHDGDDIVLEPLNPKWPARRFPATEWEKSVHLLGVMVELATPGDRNFSPRR
jgi:SOS-response transcriptional repressor LexA/DNA-binding transcriptional regulator YiaG